MKQSIPVNRPTIPQNTKKYLGECLDSGWLSSEGPLVTRFEQAFAKFVGVRYATSVNSGTTALHLALLSLGIHSGDEVIVPASTIASCYFAVWYCGAQAVPVDVDPETYTIDPNLIEKRITKRTRAIMPVHLFGHPCDMEPIIRIAKRHKLWVVEDAAEAHGAEHKGNPVGSLGDVACFSFYANKIVTCGEGGMVVTNKKKIYDRASRLKNLNHSPTRRFIHPGIGYKYVLGNLQAAVGLASLQEVRKSIRHKRQMAKLYARHLGDIPGLVLPREQVGAKSVFWMYAILVKEREFGLSRDGLMERLQEKYQIQTRSFFYPPNIAFAKMGVYKEESFPVAEQISREGLYLPSGLGNSFSEFVKVAQAVRGISHGKK